eukprot:CAMPEP_0177447476 /NCGR_PEP_ID=MMETSP0369-20130122/7648_1 /TAXON_ID=447022 ORGANISM="Scrippsiella hangoei-like, Strain SHHI-4" /NCGR_SAMPLE_ID=MMETSP0369 /ASSEMBLY_ACC=CAM_ASM_000364 /LENGTH=254 /DNA_ID=CAMNT_0018919791 /DNA_START=56 /DNA_END=820 /DNA_ORIENTATION=+
MALVATRALCSSAMVASRRRGEAFSRLPEVSVGHRCPRPFGAARLHGLDGRGMANHVVRLLTRMDEDEELPRARVLGQATSLEELAARPRPGGGVFGAHVPLYLAASTLLAAEGGRGVFCSERVGAGALVEVCPVLALNRDHVAAECAGMRYFFGGPTGETLLCVLGWGMLYNHGASLTANGSRGAGDGDGGGASGKRLANLTFSLREAPEGLRDERDDGVCVRMEAARDIEVGEELLIDYSDRWWEAKGLRPL